MIFKSNKLDTEWYKVIKTLLIDLIFVLSQKSNIVNCFTFNLIKNCFTFLLKSKIINQVNDWFLSFFFTLIRFSLHSSLKFYLLTKFESLNPAQLTCLNKHFFLSLCQQSTLDQLIIFRGLSFSIKLISFYLVNKAKSIKLNKWPEFEFKQINFGSPELSK